MLITQQKPDVNRYQLVPRTLIFLKQNDCVLLLKGSPEKKLWANLLNGVGGHVEQGEDIYAAAKRELKEETGIKDVDLKLCGIIIIDTTQPTGICLFVFTGKSQGLTFKESSEGKLSWIKFNQINSHNLVEDLYTLLPKIISWEPDQPIFTALYQTGRDGRLSISFSN